MPIRSAITACVSFAAGRARIIAPIRTCSFVGPGVFIAEHRVPRELSFGVAVGRRQAGQPVAITTIQGVKRPRRITVYRAPRTSAPHPEHRVHPYLLRGLAIERPDHVWYAEINYIPVRRGFLYLVAIMDWASRHVLAWRLSNTLDAGFCTDALEEALARYGTARP